MKHVGKMKNNSARVITVYRTLPGDHTNCLVVGTQGLIDSHHDSLMALIESDTGQQANELADIIAVRKFPDGSNMLQYLHINGHLKKVPTTMVLMTPNTQTNIPLNELNELIAKQRGVRVEDLAITDGTQKSQQSQQVSNEAEVSKLIAEETLQATDNLKIVESTEQKTEKFTLTPAEMRARADALFKEASKLRKDADALDPPKKKAKTEKIEA